MRENGNFLSIGVSYYGGAEIIKRVVLILCLFFSSFTIFASGKKDSDFQEIDALIETRDYNTALNLLEEYVNKNPDDFDNAQKRIRIIMEARSKYNNLAEELINVILNEPTNDKKKLDMISELEALEKNPNETSVKFITQTKAAAQFTYFRAMFEQYMGEGSALVKSGDYVEAAGVFNKGYALYREDFYEHSYGDEIEEPVTESLSDIENSLIVYQNLQPLLKTTSEELMKNLNDGNASGAEAAYAAFYDCMVSFAEIRNNVAKDGWLFSSFFDELKLQNPDLTEASFLPFAYRFTLGRGNDTSTGILGAMDNQWNSIIEALKPAAYKAASAKAGLFSSSSSNRLSVSSFFSYPPIYDDQKTALDETYAFTSIGLGLNNLYEKRLVSTDVFAKNPYAGYSLGMEYGSNLTSRVASILDISSEFSSLVYSFSNFAPDKQAEDEIRNADMPYSIEMQNYSNKFTAMEQSASGFASESLLEYNEIYSDLDKAVPVNTEDRKDEVLGWDEFYSSFSNIANALSSTASKYASSCWVSLASYLSEGCSSIASDYREQYENALSLFEGDKDSTLGAYPAESLAVLESYASPLSNDKISISTCDNFLLQVPTAAISAQSENTETLADTTLFSESCKIVAAAISELTRIQADSSDLSVKAKAQVVLAQRAENEAELRYRQAAAALQSGEFQTARDTIQKARVKYNESLSLQENGTLRARSDEILTALGLDINKAENEIVVKEVRQLKTQAKNAYYQGNFEQAENYLVQARTRWSTTNVEDDQEIINLLSLVGTALSMKTGRTIPVTAPLYPEMSQILNIANQYFDEGKSLIDKNRRDEAVEILNAAKQKLRELQLVYPLNQEASLLTLRIDQLIDPVSFQTLFGQKYQAARSDYKVASKQQSAYTDLLDLYEINPSYPGLKDFIYQVEIEIGVRQKPVDRSGIVKSTSLTKEAQAIVDANSRDEIALNQALAKVDEAIKLNPDNEAAMILKDRIQTSIGGQAVSVLSSESEALYQKAVQELQKGNTIEASAIVTQLLQSRQNQRSSKILDLKKRVESLL